MPVVGFPMAIIHLMATELNECVYAMLDFDNMQFRYTSNKNEMRHAHDG